MAVKKKARKKAKKKAAKKKTRQKIAINAPSRATGKRPSKRLKKRRSVNKKKGYYPNPVSPIFYVGYVLQNGTKFYYHGYSPIKKGMVFKDDIEGALWYRSPKKARDEIQYLTQRTTGEAKRIKTEKYRPK